MCSETGAIFCPVSEQFSGFWDPQPSKTYTVPFGVDWVLLCVFALLGAFYPFREETAAVLEILSATTILRAALVRSFSLRVLYIAPAIFRRYFLPEEHLVARAPRRPSGEDVMRAAASTRIFILRLLDYYFTDIY